jgi:hypothetical protein
MLEAFTILKEKFHVPHKLLLAGGEGYGYKIIHSQLANFKNKADVILTGYFPQAEKQPLLSVCVPLFLQRLWHPNFRGASQRLTGGHFFCIQHAGSGRWRSSVY